METLSVYTPTLDPYDSYGRLATELISRLDALGVYTNAFSLAGDERKKPVKPTLGGFLLGYPTNFSKFGSMSKHGKRVAITMFESTRLPGGWVENLNQCDAIIVPSNWLIDVFKQEGVRKPVYCVPLGITHEYSLIDRTENQRFTFIAIADRGRRKGWHHATHAFQIAFGDDMNYRLILKSRAGVLPERLSNPNIEILGKDLTNEEMADLFGSCDSMVFPTCGEGFGLPPREFAATGGISIVTNWGGTADDIEQWAIPIDYSMTPAWRGSRFHGLGQWAEPDVYQLATLMKSISALDLGFRRHLGRTFSKAALSLYSWDEFAKSCLEIYRSL